MKNRRNIQHLLLVEVGHSIYGPIKMNVKNEVPTLDFLDMKVYNRLRNAVDGSFREHLDSIRLQLQFQNRNETR